MSNQSIPDEIRNPLSKLATRDKQQGIRSLFEQDDHRVDKFTFDVESIYVDFSKSHLSDELLDMYLQFARHIDFTDKRHRLFSGELVNSTEQRPALHTLLRDADNQQIEMSNANLLQQAALAEAQLNQRFKEIQSRLSKRSTPITDIIHVGIGGSSLGTQVLFEALTGVDEHRKIHFIGNVDAHKLAAVLANCHPESTLVIGVSKTFTTAETLQNLQTIADWWVQQGGIDPIGNFIGVTASHVNAIDFGINQENIMVFPEWVGGRYSVWSSVSLSAILLLGMQCFDEFLSGAAAMDKHFYQTQESQNICFIAAALDHYYANFMGAGSRAIFAYDDRLRSLVSYLQQLEMESNGKDRQFDGSPADQQTAPVIWGGVGTDVQHSVFQLMHQGTSPVPSEFILVCSPNHHLQDHQDELLANGVAQTAALLSGQSLATTRKLYQDENLSELVLQSKVFSGNRASSTVLLEKLDAYSLGALLAFYEHRTFCGGVLANINSFDQMGVELGKRLAKQVKPLLLDESDEQLDQSLDPSSIRLIEKLKQLRQK